MKKKKIIGIGIAVLVAGVAAAVLLSQPAPEKYVDIQNPAYLGADENQYGEAVKTGVGENGQIANERLLEWHTQYKEEKVYPITDNVYAAIGYGAENSVMIEGDTGLVIINTGSSIQTAQKEKDAFAKISSKPIRAIIYTNYEQSFGTKAYVDGQAEPIEIIAPESHKGYIQGLVREETTAYNMREEIKTGKLIGNEGEYGALEKEASSKEESTWGYAEPTKWIPSGETYEWNEEGLSLQLIPTSSIGEDGLMVWMPEEKVCVNAVVRPSFPETYSLEGGTYQSPKKWVNDVSTILDLTPEYLVGIYGLPLTEEDDIEEEVTLYRDALQYIYSQAVRYMNKQHSVDETAKLVTLPETLASGKLTGEFMSEIEYNVRAVYNGLLGWFGMDTIEIHPVTDKFEAKKMIEGYGGTEKMLEASRAAFDEKEYAWALQLVSYIVKAEQDNQDAKLLKADILKTMAGIVTDSGTRNYYLTEAAKLEGTTVAEPTSGITKEKLLVSSKDAYLNVLRVSIVPEKAEGLVANIKVDFRDSDVSYGFHVQNNVGTVTENPAEQDATVSMEYATFCDIAVGNKSLREALEAKEVSIAGNTALFWQVTKIFER